MTDYYAILGVPRNATSTEIRDAYLKLARDTHPDKVKDPAERKKAEDVFKNVTAAYDTLSKERTRRDYTSKLPTSNEPRTTTTTTTTTTTANRTAPPMVQGAPLPPRDSKIAASAPIASGGMPGMDMLAQGIEAFKKQDYHTAVQLLNIAATNDDKNARAHAMLSLALAKNPNWIRDALSHMETASRLEPKNVSYLAELALLLHSQGLKLRARRALDSAIALKPEHPDVQRAMKEIPAAPAEPETAARNTAETARGLFDRLRKR